MNDDNRPVKPSEPGREPPALKEVAGAAVSRTLQLYFGDDSPQEISRSMKVVSSGFGILMYLSLVAVMNFGEEAFIDKVRAAYDLFFLNTGPIAFVFLMVICYVVLGLSYIIARSVKYGSMLRFFFLGFMLTAFLTTVVRIA